MKTNEILQHELIGIECEVEKSKNISQKGIRGIIIDETMKTISIDTKNGVKKIIKDGSVFRLILKDKKILVNGSYLVSRPEDRIKKKLKKW